MRRRRSRDLIYQYDGVEILTLIEKKFKSWISSFLSIYIFPSKWRIWKVEFKFSISFWFIYTIHVRSTEWEKLKSLIKEDKEIEMRQEEV